MTNLAVVSDYCTSFRVQFSSVQLLTIEATNESVSCTIRQLKPNKRKILESCEQSVTFNY